MRLRDSGPLIGCFLLVVGAVWLAQQHTFFWDTVQLGAKHADFFYTTDFSQLLLPQELDSGHPPLFGLYLAGCWRLFGATLPVSHWAMLPFLWGIVALLFALARHFGSEKTAWWLPLLVAADPVMAAQSVLVSPDVVLVFFFLLTLWSVLKQKPVIQAIALAGLALISMRGMMTAAMLFVWQFLFFSCEPRAASCELGSSKPPLTQWMRLLLKQALVFLPGALLAGGWLLWHYRQTGWIGYHPDSPWAPSFERVGEGGVARNGVILIWRLLDFGRIFMWAGLLFLLWQHRPLRAVFQNKIQQQAAGLLLLALLFLTPTLLLYKALSAHRYLLPVFLALTVWLYALAAQSPKHGLKVVVVSALLLFGGNFWVYPQHIAQGWDATLAHWPYYELRRQVLDFIEQEDLPLDSIGTAFPEIGPLHYRDLGGFMDAARDGISRRHRQLQHGFKTKDLDSDPYILWSNVMNDFSDAERAALQQDWQPLRRWKKGAVEMVLYGRGE